MSNDYRTSGTISVSGIGCVAIEPDVADVLLGVNISRKTVAEARAEAATTMAAILATVAEAGVPKRDVQSSFLSVQPRYDYRDGRPPELSGYEMNNVATITVRDLAKLGDVIDGSLRAGATSMDGLEFRLADPAPAEREARIRAMANARSRADVIAEAAALTITGVESVTEGGAMPPRPFAAKAERMMMAQDAATPVETGTMEIEVTVAVTYRTTAWANRS
ncbi:MAG TPA: SIMPL domain-containing protein [Candidatus Limnocylindrales bacterium]|nr:SIMPL domain-containing protein [Candidatus Limnocylindrales bacterium]